MNINKHKPVYIALIFAVAFLGAVAASGYSPKYTGSAWQANAAQAKLTTLNARILEDTKTAGWYSKLHLAELFLESLNRTFEYVGDDMPGQSLFNVEERPKLIHAVGSVAHASWVDLGNHNYTGVFAGGCASSYIRLSLALEPRFDKGVTV
eukprot:PhM_4_TR11681/c2_g1_i1/m.76171